MELRAVNRALPALAVALATLAVAEHGSAQPYPQQPYPQQPYPYPPPPYAPYPAYAPPPPADPRPGVIAPWDPAEPPPDGYELRSSVNSGMIISGGVFLGLFWATSAVVGATLAEEEDEEGIDGDGVEGVDWSPMYVPVAGPFIAAETTDASGAGVAVLVIDGALQLGAATLIAMGIVDRQYRVVRQAKLELVPLASGGLAVKGSF